MKNLLLYKGEPITEELRAFLPDKFNNPFSYIPHPLCIEAADLVKRYIREELLYPGEAAALSAEITAGKMFGVLIVETQENKLGYLAAFSGNLSGKNKFEFFVPPVYDLLNPDEFFKVGEREISAINEEIKLLENDSEYLRLIAEIENVKTAGSTEIQTLKNIYKEGKKNRELRRKELLNSLNDADSASSLQAGNLSATSPQTDDRSVFFMQTDNNSASLLQNSVDYVSLLQKESQFQKAEIKRAEKRLKLELEPLFIRLETYNKRLNRLKAKRKEMSAALQNRIFEQFTFQNANGETSSLFEIFNGTPPSGAGECAAPKLLQYAYLNGYKPLVMGEFWWGDSPIGEIRKHGEFYPSCKSKCAPILGFMLQGLDVDSTLFHTTYGLSCEFNADTSPFYNEPLTHHILYEDELILAIDKPSGILSVPGKSGDYTRGPGIQLGTPKIASSSLTDAQTSLESMSSNNVPLKAAHRLDMHTSGVLLFAKTDTVYKELQRQFASREVEKCYVAILDGILTPDKCGSGVEITSISPQLTGIVRLPLISDYENRPSQKVDLENGKEAVTRFAVSKIENGKTFIEFYPITGRTHQLRVHSAHQLGLNTPILGDILYGKPSQRLYLHAKSVKFTHPIKGRITIFSKVPF